MADLPGDGCDGVSLKIGVHADGRKVVEGSVMKAGHDSHLNSIGVVPGALNDLPTKNALYWLGQKMSTQ